VRPVLNRILSTFGIPKVIRSDNGPPFNGAEFAAFAEEMGFEHRKVTPGWPEANGEAERFMRTLGKVIKTAKAADQPWPEELNKFLRNYRTTPHPATGVAPAELLFGRLPESRLPHLQQHDAAYKKKLKEAADQQRKVREPDLKPGDKVLLRRTDSISNKTDSVYEPDPYEVTKINGTMVTARNQQKEITRNVSLFKKLLIRPTHLQPEEEDRQHPDPAEQAAVEENNINNPQQPPEEAPVRRSGRAGQIDPCIQLNVVSLSCVQARGGFTPRR